MGHTSYNSDSRDLRSVSMNYASAPVDDLFKQNREKKTHESMSPRGITFRECRDNETHPFTVPIILTLDVTGSMGHIPLSLIREGLPTLMGNMIQRGCKDASLLFLAVGDHECDRAPLQVGQFESGDEELDMWLTRTWLEKGGGGNAGESYMLAHYFAAYHTEIDAFTKRGKKGFLITIGDEPFLTSYPATALKELMGDSFKGQKTKYSAQELVDEAKKRYNVFHLNLNKGTQDQWNDLLGQNAIFVEDYTKVPEIVANIVLSHSGIEHSTPSQTKSEESKPSSEDML